MVSVTHLQQTSLFSEFVIISAVCGIGRMCLSGLNISTLEQQTSCYLKKEHFNSKINICKMCVHGIKYFFMDDLLFSSCSLFEKCGLVLGMYKYLKFQMITNQKFVSQQV